jgi:hypothetical protein
MPSNPFGWWRISHATATERAIAKALREIKLTPIPPTPPPSFLGERGEFDCAPAAPLPVSLRRAAYKGSGRRRSRHAYRSTLHVRPQPAQADFVMFQPWFQPPSRSPQWRTCPHHPSRGRASRPPGSPSSSRGRPRSSGARRWCGTPASGAECSPAPRRTHSRCSCPAADPRPTCPARTPRASSGAGARSPPPPSRCSAAGLCRPRAASSPDLVLHS